jgi:hypothetical protein
LRNPESRAAATEPLVHVLKDGVRCDTESRGHATPSGRSPLELVVNVTEGFIPLWAPDTTLRWRIRESSLQSFENPQAAAAAIEELLGEALMRWGDAAPVKFTKGTDAWDFEIVMRNGDDCDINGCVLASSFFPDGGRHQVTLYPKLFGQPREEQVETLIHEIGHVFGLRHFFAQVSETAFPSEIFGTHNKFTIMNYGPDSVLTQDDKADLKRLYRMAWAGELTHINGTPIKFVNPFHTVGEAAENAVLVAQTAAPREWPRRPGLGYPGASRLAF